MNLNSLLKPKWVVLIVFVICTAIPLAVLAQSSGRPSDVAGLQGRAGFTQIRLSWQLASGADGYEVAVYPDQGADSADHPVFNTLTDGQELSIPNMVCDEGYRVTVRAYRGTKKERFWQRGKPASLTIHTRKPQVPAPVISSEAVSPEKIDLSWSAVSPKEGAFTWILHAEEKELEIRRPRNFAEMTMTFHMTGLKADTLYQWKVETIYRLGEKSYRSWTNVEARTKEASRPPAKRTLSAKTPAENLTKSSGKGDEKNSGRGGKKETPAIPDELEGVPVIVDGDTLFYYE